MTGGGYFARRIDDRLGSKSSEVATAYWKTQHDQATHKVGRRPGEGYGNSMIFAEVEMMKNVI